MDLNVPPISEAARKNLRRRKVILSLSGGGYRGLFTAHVLDRLHRELGNGRLLDRVDMFAGTSIGGIIATALATGCKPERIKKLLVDRGPRIFPSKWFRTLRQGMGKAFYDPKNLREVIKEAIPTADKVKLGQLDKPLVLPTVSWNTSKLHVLSSGAFQDSDGLGLTLMDAMLATSAAPTYFPAHTVAGHVFVDGGLAANAPDLIAIQRAKVLWGEAVDIVMVSIGTASSQPGQDPLSMPQRGMTLVKPLLDVVMAAQEIHATTAAAAALGESSYLRLNFTQPANQQKRLGLDVANAGSTSILTSMGDECIASLSDQQKALLKSILSE